MKALRLQEIIQQSAEEESQQLIVMPIHFIRLRVKTTEINFPMVEVQLVEWTIVLSKISKIT
jgi:hypothetical protein